MPFDREAIFTALETRLKEVPGITTFARKVRLWKYVQPAEHPAMFLAKGHEAHDNRESLPPKMALQAILYLYTYRADDEAPSVQMNELLTEIENVLVTRAGEESVPDGSTTLGGAVRRCYIQSVEADEGALGNQSVSIVTIEMLLP